MANGQCQCTNGFVPASDGLTCYCQHTLSMDEQRCLAGCPEHQTPSGGKCVCTDGHTPTADGTDCECATVLDIRGKNCLA